MDTIPSGTTRTGKITSHQVGACYEAIARRYLERSGLRFIDANIKYRGGELDLIMQDGDIWVFVEVRYRRNAYYGHAADSITWHKRQRLLYAAARWLNQRQLCLETTNCRFDVLAITGNQLQWLPNAFNADGST
ncbi:YraN family protein [Pragia fontium]|uniref:UPF0102 protein SOASR032_26260 n=1 Tax=Pragia fontium TaxID=82985 RepID=A0ABQ5LMG3_9GAMM|nr:YraN family protein [Pragia fontium]AKJ43945.1 hypothetical protein QQ39_15215 [Pragia fontium]GKX64057.1 UPF0102 protein [Pragia fontium]SUB83694.1 Uncharacterised protein family UPF0102 [Pragia fontium]VEJ56602.1 Uncharacterised protein family UPF0102 [Pragia fontium]